MRRKTVNGAPFAAFHWSTATRPASRFSTLARVLISEIEGGRLRVGEKIPTESELAHRFGVSRHTVREALRELKNQGMLVGHPGMGTIVRAKSLGSRFGQGVSTLREIAQFVGATRMRVVGRSEIIADREWANRLDCEIGQLWHETSVLRYVPREALPIAQLSIYVLDEHRDVTDMIDGSEIPVINLLERLHGVRVIEVRQEIVAVALDAVAGRQLKAAAGTPALQITRHCRSTEDRVVMISVGQYPSDRFSETTTFTLPPEDGTRGSGE